MIDTRMGRRDFIRRATAGGAAIFGGGAGTAWAKDINLGLPSAPSERPLTKDFPQKGEMIFQRVRPPLLETPFSVFDDGVFTPNAAINTHCLICHSAEMILTQPALPKEE